MLETLDLSLSDEDWSRLERLSFHPEFAVVQTLLDAARDRVVQHMITCPDAARDAAIMAKALELIREPLLQYRKQNSDV